jgi:O-antigen ligase
LEFYRNSLAIFRDHPIVGVGTGGFVKAYAEKVKDMGMMATTNPHDEYLMIATQLGAIGLTALLFMFYRQWRAAAKLNGYRRAMARGMLIAIAVGGLVSSTLMDHSEGLFYAWMSGLLYSGLREKRA